MLIHCKCEDDETILILILGSLLVTLKLQFGWLPCILTISVLAIYILYRSQGRMLKGGHIFLPILAHIQFPKMNVVPSENKPYIKGVPLTGQNPSLKRCQSLCLRLYQQGKFRSFKRVTLCLCWSKDSKVVVCQTLSMIPSSRIPAQAALV